MNEEQPNSKTPIADLLQKKWEEMNKSMEEYAWVLAWAIEWEYQHEGWREQ
jgi:hypothetical protein